MSLYTLEIACGLILVILDVTMISRRRTKRVSTYIAALFAVIAAPGAYAEAPRLNIELNAAQTSEAGCTLSFLVTNALGAPLEQIVFQTVLFDTSMQVTQLSLFDFGSLPIDRPRVRQFVFPGDGCQNIGRILFNGAQACEGINIPASACETAVTLSSRTSIEVLG